PLHVPAEISTAVPPSQYPDSVVGRRPITPAVHVCGPGGRVAVARDRSEVGARVEPAARFERALGGERETRVSGDDRPLGRLATEGAARSYSVLIPLAYPSGEAAGVLEVTQDLGPIASDMALARWMIVLIVVAVSAVLVGLTA